MKKIKFRGKEIKSNKYVYGFFIRCIDDCVIVTSEGLKTVYPDSVAQFVGYDKNGNEFYEDDEVRIYDLDGSSKNYTGKRFKIYEIEADYFHSDSYKSDIDFSQSVEDLDKQFYKKYDFSPAMIDFIERRYNYDDLRNDF